MKTIGKILGIAAAAGLLATSGTPAMARDHHGGYRGGGHSYGGHGYGHGYRRGGDRTGAAILGGVIGLGLGAAIVSGSNRDRGYDRGYDGYREYDDYRPTYRGRSGAYIQDCEQRLEWDPYYREYVPVRTCY